MFRANRSFKQVQYEDLLAKIEWGGEKASDDEWTVFVHSQALFDFLGDFGKLAELFARHSEALAQKEIEVLARLAFPLSFYQELAAVSSSIADIIVEKITKELAGGRNLSSLKPATLLELVILFANNSRLSSRAFRWQELLIRRLRDGLGSLSPSAQLMAIWHVTVFDRAHLHSFERHLAELIDTLGNRATFYELYLLNQLVGLLGPSSQVILEGKRQQLAMMLGEGRFKESLVNFELGNFSEGLARREELALFLRDIAVTLERGLNEKVEINQVVTTDTGLVFFSPIYVPGKRLCLFLTNEDSARAVAVTRLTKMNAACLSASGYTVRFVSASSLLTRSYADTAERIDEIETLKLRFLLNAINIH